MLRYIMAFFKLGTSPSYTLTAFVCDAIEKASYSKEKRTSIYIIYVLTDCEMKYRLVYKTNQGKSRDKRMNRQNTNRGKEINAVPGNSNDPPDD